LVTSADIDCQRGREVVKISSGWSKGLKILTPAGLDTRPTRERIRQSALNMLTPWIPGARVLDLFAGSGAVGIELVSRGATGAVFVEVARPALECLRHNTKEAKSRADKQDISLLPWSVEAKDAHVFIRSSEISSFDLIWADPPYELAENFMLQCGLQLSNALSQGGVFCLESGVETESWLSQWGQGVGLELIKQRPYGVTLISIWKKN
jgi:16S rRNA (guanine966-N2)-methyltransferase